MPRCPVCGEKLSSFDRQHMKTKHPEFQNTSRKYRFIMIFSGIACGILGLMLVYFEDSPNHLAIYAIVVLLIVDFALFSAPSPSIWVWLGNTESSR